MEIANLLSVPPGNLVYHLTIAMALAVILSLAHVYKTRTALPTASAWILAAGTLLGLRLILLAFDGLGLWKNAEGGTLIPSFERFVSLSGLVAFLWLCKLPTPKLSKLFFLIGAAISIAVLILSPIFLHFFEASEPFNHSKVDALWSLTSLGIALLASVSLLVMRPKDWDFAFGPFILLTLGIMLHISLGPWNGSTAGFVRLAEIAAYPLFAIYTARSLASTQFEVEPQLEIAPVIPQSSNLMMFSEALSDLTALMQVQEQAELARQVVEVMAKRMDADHCLMVIPGEQKEKIMLVTGFDLQQKRHLRSKAIQSRDIPRIAEALQHRKKFQLQEQRAGHDLQTLKGILGQARIGPTMFIPISTDNITFGGLILISSPSAGPWSSIDFEIVEMMAMVLSRRLKELKSLKSHEDFRKGRERLAQTEQRVQALENEKNRLEQAMKALEAKEKVQMPHEQALSAADHSKEEYVPKKDFELLLGIHEADQEEILKLQDEIKRMKSASEAKGEQIGDTRVQELLEERQLALRELAHTRNSLSKLEYHLPEEKMSSAKATEYTSAIVSTAQELRQPMSSIMGYTELLLTESVGLLGAMQQKFLERIHNATERIKALLNHLIQLIDQESQPISFAPGPVEVINCLEQAISQVSILLREKQITLAIDYPESHAPVLGDEDAITQILYHLLYNAVKASPAGEEVQLKLCEETFDSKRYLMFSAYDRGGGIPADQLPHVFQRAYGADRISIKGIGDQGVGLSIVKSLSEKLGGRVWVNSEVGKGSAFTVLLPIAEIAF
jgi:signal transduction histidine kinase